MMYMYALCLVKQAVMSYEQTLSMCQPTGLQMCHYNHNTALRYNKLQNPTTLLQ